MIAAATTTYLVTGANRGIGLGLVTTYLARPNSTIVAAVRDPNHATSKALADLPKGAGSNLIVVKIDSLSETDADQAIAELQSKYNITALDVVVANAGVASVYPAVHEAQAKDMIEHYRINVVAVPILLRAVLPLLKQSTQGAKFVTIGSVAGTIGDMEKVAVPNAAYGPSKAAVSWISRKIHFENPDLISFNVHPGWVQTEMGNKGAVAFGLESAPQTLEESISGLVKLFDGATRETSGGKFLSYDGTELVW